MAENRESGITFSGLLTVVFIGLKLAKVIDWSWVWVLSPIWVPIILVAIIMFMLVVIETLLEDK